MTPKPRVLITRPQGHTEALCAALEQRGFVPVSLPLIAIAPCDATQHHAWRTLAAADWIVFTSANGVAHAWDYAPAVFESHPNIAVVGPATARAVETRGGRVQLVAPVHVAESLADALGDVRGARIVWLRGHDARTVLADTLRAGGARVDEIIVYHTIPAVLPPDANERARSADVITFASPSAVRHFAAQFGTSHVRRVVCIGPITANAARASGFHVDAVAETYTADGVLAALTHLHV